MLSTPNALDKPLLPPPPPAASFVAPGDTAGVVALLDHIRRHLGHPAVVRDCVLRDLIEDAVIQLFTYVLTQVDQLTVTPSTTFFELGGDSIAVLHLTRLLTAAGWPVDGLAVYRHPSVRAFAHHCLHRLGEPRVPCTLQDTQARDGSHVRRLVLATTVLQSCDLIPFQTLLYAIYPSLFSSPVALVRARYWSATAALSDVSCLKHMHDEVELVPRGRWALGLRHTALGTSEVWVALHAQHSSTMTWAMVALAFAHFIRSQGLRETAVSDWQAMELSDPSVNKLSSSYSALQVLVTALLLAAGPPARLSLHGVENTRVDLDPPLHLVSPHDLWNWIKGHGPLHGSLSGSLGSFRSVAEIDFILHPRPSVPTITLRITPDHDRRLALVTAHPAVGDADTVPHLLTRWKVSLFSLTWTMRRAPTAALDLADIPMPWPATAAERALVSRRALTGGIPPHQVEHAHRCTSLQESFVTRLARNPAAYVVQVTFHISDPALTLDLFEAMWTATLERFPILRSRFLTDLPFPQISTLRFVLAGEPVRCAVEDWTYDTLAVQRTKHERLLADDRARGFTLQGPLTRFRLTRLSTRVHRALWTVHHALVDGWSGPLVLRHAVNVFHELTGRSHLVIEPRPDPSGPDFAIYTRCLADQDPKLARHFWTAQLAGITACPALPLIPPHDETLVGYARCDLTLQVTRPALTNLARRYCVTSATVLRAAWGLLMARYHATEDLVVGTVVSGRHVPLAGIENTVGPCVNTVPLRVRPRVDQRLGEYLTAVQTTYAASIPYETCGLSEIRRWCGVSGLGELFNSLVVYQNYPDAQVLTARDDGNGTPFTDYAVHEATEYPLAAQFQDVGDSLSLTLVYSRAAVCTEAATELTRQVDTLLTGMVTAAVSAEPHLGELPWLDPARVTELTGADKTIPDLPFDLTPFQLLERTAARHPHRELFSSDTLTLTFTQTVILARRLGQELRTRYRSGSGTVIGVFTENDVAGAFAMISVGASGAAYVVADSKQPAERLDYIFRDSGCRLILTTATLRPYLPLSLANLPVLLVDPYLALPPTTDSGATLSPLGTPDDLAYILYTSGTTGRPKGVMVTRANVVNFAFTALRRVPFHDGISIFQPFSLSFDAAGTAIYLGMVHGSTIVFPGTDLTAAMRRCDMLIGTPSYLARLPWDNLPRLQYVAAGAEAFTARLKSQLCSRAQVFNGYGPTETTIIVLGSWITANCPITIGRPYPNTLAYIVGPDGRLLPPGVAGDLWIGGPSVTAGYLHRPELTAEKFIANPFGPGRVYKTGDRARYRPDGNVEYLGRVDHQVKVGGFRIELEEIETTLQRHPAVTGAVVLVRDDKLVGYVQTSGLDMTTARTFLHQHLPHYMIPRHLVSVAQFTLLPSGKVDRSKLPDYTALPVSTEPTVTPADVPLPSHALIIRNLWAGLLDRAPTELDGESHFFELGGDSLTALKFLAQLQAAGLRSNLPNLHAHPTLLAFAARVTPCQAGDTATVTDESPMTGPQTLTPIQRGFFTLALPNRHHFNQSFMFRVHGLVTLAAVRRALLDLMDHHPQLRARYHQTKSGWTQSIPSGPPGESELTGWEVKVTAANQLDRTLQRIQSRLHLIRGPLMAFGLLRGPGAVTRLFLVAHHLNLDFFSWRILGEDLDARLRQRPLPPPTTPYPHWAAALNRYAQNFQADLWPRQRDDTPTADDDAPRPLWVKPGLPSRRTLHQHTLNSQLSTSLIRMACQIHRSTLANALLAGFLAAYTSLANQPVVDLQMECHGRETLDVPLDVTRTVGWFTTIFPLHFTVAPGSSFTTALDHVRSTMAAVPHNGFVYNLIEHGMGDGAIEEARQLRLRSPRAIDLSFNYFGSFDTLAKMSTGRETPRLTVDWAPERDMHNFPRHQPMLNSLNAMSQIVDGCIQIMLEYDASVHAKAFIDQLLQDWLATLAAAPAGQGSGDL
ncbi:hypothetical protein IWQ60_010901 [Tieghemiomyces parasiticus]|uniref:Carrier domain-containing protein n=1 Tax=Tieghemiomyces parasiticus TaxID=78921 RepID=A0A9W7ZT84_9FUNG|nr:hypothetical protein IWQ60_010901 [Tieghemiomyces parasiticus]